MNEIILASNVVGGQATLAKLLGVTPPTVNQWVTGKRKIPVNRCPTIERVTGGEVRCEDLRHDVEWWVVRGTPPLAPARAEDREET
jgi:DNA-binding transcriptional regulator YdaS (Cro superfamily)